MVEFRTASDNIFADLGSPPAEALELKLRSTLRINLEDFIENSELTRAQLAEDMGISQARVEDLLHAKFKTFDLDELLTIAANIGWKVSIALERGAEKSQAAA